jgi:hypothetical protein
MYGADRGNTQCPTDRARNHVGAVPMRVNYFGTKALDQPPKALVFADITPASNHEWCHRDAERAKGLHERVVLCLFRRENRSYVNSAFALPIREHSHNALEAALLSRGEHVKGPCLAPRLGRQNLGPFKITNILMSPPASGRHPSAALHDRNTI